MIRGEGRWGGGGGEGGYISGTGKVPRQFICIGHCYRLDLTPIFPWRAPDSEYPGRGQCGMHTVKGKMLLARMFLEKKAVQWSNELHTFTYV